MELVRIGRPGSRYTVLAICDSRGDCLVLDFLAAMDAGERRLRDRLLAFLREHVSHHGPPMGNVEQCKDLGDGIFEFKRDDVRILWFWDKGNLVLCSHAFRKRRKRTSRKEIVRAKLLRSNYWAARDQGKLVVRDP